MVTIGDERRNSTDLTQRGRRHLPECLQEAALYIYTTNLAVSRLQK